MNFIKKNWEDERFRKNIMNIGWIILNIITFIYIIASSSISGALWMNIYILISSILLSLSISMTYKYFRWFTRGARYNFDEFIKEIDIEKDILKGKSVHIRGEIAINLVVYYDRFYGVNIERYQLIFEEDYINSIITDNKEEFIKRVEYELFRNEIRDGKIKELLK